MVYFIWWAHNECIFQDKFILTPTTTALVVKLSSEFKCEIKVPKQRPTISLEIDKQIPWGFFDGACQGNPPKCGAGTVLFISDHFLKH
jgi:hypothetical protein